MHATALVTLNMRELDRLKVVQAVVELGLKPGRAAERLGLTVRQVERLVTRYRELGAAGLASRKRGRRVLRVREEPNSRRSSTQIWNGILCTLQAKMLRPFCPASRVGSIKKGHDQLPLSDYSCDTVKNVTRRR